MKRLLTSCLVCCLMIGFAYGQQRTSAVNLAKATIVYHAGDAPLVKHMAQVLADDIERVSGMRPEISTRKVKGNTISIGTVAQTGRHRELRGAWERYAIDTKDGNVAITGSDARGLAYGVLHVSEAIGVSPWYWFADVPIDKAFYSHPESQEVADKWGICGVPHDNLWISTTAPMPLDTTRNDHVITLSIVDPGQIIQKITYQSMP